MTARCVEKQYNLQVWKTVQKAYCERYIDLNLILHRYGNAIALNTNSIVIGLLMNKQTAECDKVSHETKTILIEKPSTGKSIQRRNQYLINLMTS